MALDITLRNKMKITYNAITIVMISTSTVENLGEPLEITNFLRSQDFNQGCCQQVKHACEHFATCQQVKHACEHFATTPLIKMLTFRGRLLKLVSRSCIMGLAQV